MIQEKLSAVELLFYGTAHGTAQYKANCKRIHISNLVSSSADRWHFSLGISDGSTAHCVRTCGLRSIMHTHARPSAGFKASLLSSQTESVLVQRNKQHTIWQSVFLTPTHSLHPSRFCYFVVSFVRVWAVSDNDDGLITVRNICTRFDQKDIRVIKSVRFHHGINHKIKSIRHRIIRVCVRLFACLLCTRNYLKFLNKTWRILYAVICTFPTT